MRKRVLMQGHMVTLVAAGLLLWAHPGAAQQPTSAASAAELSAADSSHLKGPRQPVFFRHDLHAGQFKIPCQYCHYTVSISTEPGIPSMQTCMGCHLVISGSDSGNKVEIGKLRKAWFAKQPIEWVRVHRVANHVHFPHQQHIKALGPVACATCHGNVSRMPRVFAVNNVHNMGWCITCHLERNVTRDCTACHY
ncbi:MAG: cytochrome c3 family protein [Gemmatimonadales bacterium]